MAGPAAIVVSPVLLTPAVVRAILVGLDVEFPQEGVLSVLWTDGTVAHFDLVVQDLGQRHGYRRDSDFEARVRAIGWKPLSEIVLAAHRNTVHDHRALAWLAAEVADQVHGVIDVDGRLNLPAMVRELETGDGQVREVRYQAEDGNFVLSDIVTPAFLRRWRQDASFRMIK